MYNSYKPLKHEARTAILEIWCKEYHTRQLLRCVARLWYFDVSNLIVTKILDGEQLHLHQMLPDLAMENNRLKDLFLNSAVCSYKTANRQRKCSRSRHTARQF